MPSFWQRTRQAISNLNNSVRDTARTMFGGTAPIREGDWTGRVVPESRPIPEQQYPEPQPEPIQYFPDEPEQFPSDIVAAPEPEQPWFGNEITIPNEYGEDVSFTFEDWFNEATMRDQEYLLEMYGLDNLDIIRNLISQGYDWEVTKYDEYGEPYEVSGLWEEWREQYEQAF